MPVVWGKTRAHRSKCWWGNVYFENLVNKYYFNFSVKRLGNKRFNQIPPHLAMLIYKTNCVSDTHILTRKQAGSITHCKLNPTCRLEFSGPGLFGWPERFNRNRKVNRTKKRPKRWTIRSNFATQHPLENRLAILHPRGRPGITRFISEGKPFQKCWSLQEKYNHLFSNDVIHECSPEAWWKKSGESKWWQSIFSLPCLPSIHDPVLTGSDIGSFSVSLHLLNTHSDVVCFSGVWLKRLAKTYAFELGCSPKKKKKWTTIRHE